MNVIEVDTREGYNQWASQYDTNGNPLVALEQFALSKMLKSVEGLKVIDLGCGTGRNTIRLHDLGAETEGVDFSEGMLSRARERSYWKNIVYTQHDLTKPLPYHDDSFDLVLSSLVIEH